MPWHRILGLPKAAIVKRNEEYRKRVLPQPGSRTSTSSSSTAPSPWLTNVFTPLTVKPSPLIWAEYLIPLLLLVRASTHDRVECDRLSQKDLRRTCAHAACFLYHSTLTSETQAESAEFDWDSHCHKTHVSETSNTLRRLIDKDIRPRSNATDESGTFPIHSPASCSSSN